MPRAEAATLLVLLAAACAHPRGSDAARRVRCEQLTPDVRAQMTAAGELNEKNYRAALAAQNLTPVGLPQRQVGRWSEEDVALAQPEHPPGTSFEESGKQWVAGPFISVPNGQLADPYFEFVKDPAGDIYQLERTTRVLSSQSIVLCGCGPTGSGAAPHVEQVVYELPAGASFRGTAKIAYDVRLYEISYSGTDERGERCEPPP